jgi:hypothetical protein
VTLGDTDGVNRRLRTQRNHSLACGTHAAIGPIYCTDARCGKDLLEEFQGVALATDSLTGDDHEVTTKEIAPFGFNATVVRAPGNR